MTVRDLKEILQAEVICCEERMESEVHAACGSDMMSDVLAFVKDQAVLLTGLVNPQVIRTAEMMDMICVIFVRGKIPGETIVDLAKEKEICILTTSHPMFTACGILYQKGLRGGCA
jgi:predicted transcriptional regulator